jgi:signal transduction histidine kinase/DNA-binding response OmpR family regulator
MKDRQTMFSRLYQHYLVHAPFRNKLMALTLAVTGFSLVSASLGLMLVQYVNQRETSNQRFTHMIGGLGFFLAGSLAKDDALAVREANEGAVSVPEILWQNVYGRDGRLLAQYYNRNITQQQRLVADDARKPRQSSHLSHTFHGLDVHGSFASFEQRIYLKGQQVGRVSVGYRYHAISEVLLEMLPMASVIWAVCMAMAVLMTSRMRRTAFKPLEALQAAMQKVRVSGDLDARVAVTGDPDFDGFITSYNSMLDTLAAQNNRLSAAMRDLGDARDASEAANVAKSEFLANMSHELRTPLNAIIGYGEVLRDDLARAGMTRSLEDVGWICSSSQQLLELINSLLDLSKIEAGKMELDIHSFDAAKLMAEVEALLMPLAAKQGNQLAVVCDGELDTVVGDSTKLRQCLLNLGSNACKFTKGGFVELRARADADDLVLTISDTGIGMSESEIARLFQPFTQSDSSTTRRYGGTGLGLALVARFCQMMRGEVNVSSEPGFGSIFTIRLPRDQSKLPATKWAEPQVALAPRSENLPVSMRARGEKPLAMIVEDEPSGVELLRRMLQRQGYEVVVANDGQAALDLARHRLPDIVLLDLGLPGLDGWSVLEALGVDEVTRHIPVIIISADDRRRISLAKGASDHLVKPVKGEELEAILQLYAARRSGQILLVEDDEAIGALYEKGLVQAGFCVKRVTGGFEAEALLDSEHFALIITDLKMPMGDGFGLLRKLAMMPEGKHPPVMVMTGQPLNALERDILAQRSCSILPKAGLSPRNLVFSVSEMLDAA